MWAVVRQPQARQKVACYDKTARYRFMVVAGALVEISGDFHDKLFIKLLKTEEATASSASMLATPLEMRTQRVTATRYTRRGQFPRTRNSMRLASYAGLVRRLDMQYAPRVLHFSAFHWVCVSVCLLI